MQNSRRDLLAHILPFGAFMAFIGVGWLLATLFKHSDNMLLSQSQYWIFPLQTAVCAGLLCWYWKSYPFSLKGLLFGTVAGLLALVIWLSPQAFLGFAPRTDGFNPEVFNDSPLLYWLSISARFARLVIVVPLLEEIFWRGFLMRYLINEKFTDIAFGTYSSFSFFAVAILFMFEHNMPDWIPALITGLIYNAVAVKTRSLLACVVAHAVTNLGLGIYIMTTRQWGFW